MHVFGDQGYYKTRFGISKRLFLTPLENTKKKIDSDGRHLLLGFIIDEVEPKKFRTIGWKLVDLSKILVSMKLEFNANNVELYKPDAVVAENCLKFY
ncbi:hypothetical protein [Archaeoglobus sp.]